jgi:two-component system CheB/CheR fusion protein
MVTEFFRDREAFAVLGERVIPEILSGKPEGTALRLWVPGCASGEEAYSLALTLLDVMAKEGVSRPLKIFATDINERDLERARRGSYPESIAEAVGSELLGRYFVSAAGGYQISKAVRDCCVFARHDLTRDPPFPKLDLVSCRNVLIYMGAALQRRILPLFHYALLPGGCLMLGQGESLGSCAELFETVDARQRLFARKAGPSPQIAPLAFAPTILEGRLGSGQPELSEHVRSAASDADGGGEAERALLADFVPPGVTVDSDLEVIRFRGETTPFLCNPPGRPTHKLLDMICPDLRDELQAALKEAELSGTRAVRRGIDMGEGEAGREVDLHVVPFASAGGELNFVVLFEDVVRSTSGPAVQQPTLKPPQAREIERLRRELRLTRDRQEALAADREAANEELRAANEEILSSSEEMQSVNEELETASEELQSTNEELQSRNSELWQVNDDLSNLLTSTSFPIIMVGRDLHIRRYTPEAGRLLKVIPADVGRPIEELALHADLPDLAQLLREVIDTLTPIERSVRDVEGRWYEAQVRPYETAEHRIDGAILTLIDIDEISRRYQDQRRIALTLQENFVHPLPVIDGLELASLSEPASRGELVGGDFHDAFQLPNGPVVALIGDVMGKGIKAAGFAERVRGALRTLAFISPSPAYVLKHANVMLLHEGEHGQLVTVLLVILDPATGRGSVASAGHPPALQLSDHGCRFIELQYGLPLGSMEQSFAATSLALEPGEALVLYTDGATEARREGELFGEQRLIETLRAAADRSPAALLETLRAAVTSFAGELQDDLQILALRRDAADS